MGDRITADRAAQWYDYWRRRSGTRDERKALEAREPPDVIAAYDWVQDRIERGGRDAVLVLAHLAEAAPEGDDGVIVGVGPLEDLLSWHGDGIVDQLIEQARRTPALARALTHAWLGEGDVSADSIAKLRSLGSRNAP